MVNKNKINEKVAVALSGGVDSSFAAYLLKKKGYQVEGFTFLLCSQDGRCLGDQGLIQAQKVCDKLKIPHHILDFKKLFRKQIIDDFLRHYSVGLTPNPCVLCNALIKFGYFFEHIDSRGFKYLATGHYVGLKRIKGKIFLKVAKDEKKSQEYFLSLISPSILNRLIFPLANYTKDQVLAEVVKLDILFHDRGESQDICFINGQAYSQFIKENVFSPEKYKGNICHVNGKILGTHEGIYNFTYGQRSGLGVAWRQPLYVISIEEETKTVFVGEKEYLYKKEFTVNDLNWFDEITKYKKIEVKIRYNTPSLKCKVQVMGKEVKVSLDDKVQAITPGQIAAFYSGDILLGGGIINSC
ncbi:MAG: tRNA 2-thiouridine(34) synthase MnmA [Candidatus Omnitrophota bacterium]|nr:tRNA 2-thiouridine(34) synthase MnmA [Candidatus Omnitrophota bacterium]